MKNTFKDAYIYSLLNLDKVAQKIVTEVNPKLDNYKIDDENLNAITSDIKSKANGIGKEKIIRCINNGDIILINAPGISLPAWCIPINGKIIAVCNIFGKVRVSKDKKLVYQVKEIFGLLVVADTLKNFFRSEGKFLYNSSLISNIGVVYSRIFMRVIDSMFSVNSIGNERESQFIEYMIIKFYLRRVVEKKLDSRQEASNIASIMSKSKKNSTIVYSIAQHEARASEFDDSQDFKSIDTFCKAMAKNINGLNRLETNILIRKMIMLLGEKSALMLETPQFLFAYLASSAYSTNLIKDYQVASIAGDLLGNIAADIVSIDV